MTRKIEFGGTISVQKKVKREKESAPWWKALTNWDKLDHPKSEKKKVFSLKEPDWVHIASKPRTFCNWTPREPKRAHAAVRTEINADHWPKLNSFIWCCCYCYYCYSSWVSSCLRRWTCWTRYRLLGLLEQWYVLFLDDAMLRHLKCSSIYKNIYV